MRAPLTAILVAVGLTQASAGDTYEGRAEVVDGDTVAITGAPARFRLYGIDAPEGKQTCDDAAGKRYLCGSRSAQHLADLIGRSGTLRCVEEDRDRYGRIVAECSLPSGLVVNRQMVRDGWAVEYRQYSDGRYSEAETEAKAAKRGIWGGTFVVPSEWRKGERSGRAADEAGKEGTRPSPPGNGQRGCAIKGNVSRSGRIYHVPGQADYDRTKIDERKGERWFCSAAEAEAAGWRAARR